MIADRFVLCDDSVMFLEIELRGSVGQLHWTPRVWSHNWVKHYRHIINIICEELEDNTEILYEFIRPENTHKQKLMRLLGFQDSGGTDEIRVFTRRTDERL